MLNDYGIKGYGGPCPPKGHGMHRYQFTVWALPNEKLDVKENTSNAVIGFMLNANALDKARITATYVNE
ncbi:putative kinase inhibitor [Piscirickettsia salmonis]|uniref:Kinase inhibitor n=2 Tax=Piscirickettsia salmonis TaxID=1238 RepID=A0AAC8VFW2_PISSA|nr:YbhB/YbcL family Raf kinase inhibitor-like protein [Piscirickettsia salmonis]ALB21642.1 kinase inhibitor [Piscirickettsia salmonis]QGN99738.1 putative kinase inhibitor [Piscirickettsia salmonis]QGO03389.1 putative kinase inhibitor [Piscirickettsia salmonis]QGO14020.1 putative kinase inhibitor [Piscirickettsia salmonis]QGO21117.1 putative kinase inhibitor [Piscirickettsia salmonis]